MLNKEQKERYSRHLLLKEVGPEGQEKLCSAKVLIIGAGGLGCPAALYLAAAGVGEIGIIDFDKVEISNLQRQILYSTADAGNSKAETAGKRLAGLNPLIRLNIYDRKLDQQAALELFPQYDIILDGSDNFSTRYLVNDACVLMKKPLVYGSIHRFEGQVSVFNAALPDGRRGPTYRCLFPEPPAPGSIGNCSEVGVLGTLPGLVGTMQASETIKIITGIGEILSGKLLLLNTLNMDFNTLTFQGKTHPVLTNDEFLKVNYDLLCGVSAETEKTREIKSGDLLRMLEQRSSLFIIDVREPGEMPSDEGLADVQWPLSSLNTRTIELPAGKKVILFCKSGVRSRKAANIIKEKTKTNELFSLSGGILQWLENQLT